MKIYIPLLLFITLTISFSSCSKDDEEESTTTTTTTTTTTSGSTTTATGSISVGSESLTGSYSSSCLTTDRTGTTVPSSSDLPSNTKALKYYLIVTSSSSVEFSEYFYSDASCSTSNISMAELWTYFSVDNASGSNYKITYTKYSSSYTPYDTTAKSFLDTSLDNTTTATGPFITTTIGTATTILNDSPRKDIIYVSSNSVKVGNSSASDYPSSVYDTEMTK